MEEAHEDVFGDGHAQVHPQVKLNYNQLDTNAIKARQRKTVVDVADLLALSLDEASRVLRHYNWDRSTVEEGWFSDEERARQRTGILGEAGEVQGLKCGICMDEYKEEDIKTAVCGTHPFCRVCWSRYIEDGINKGPKCLTLTCPQPRCQAAVLDGMVRSLVEPNQAQLYNTFLMRSFAETSKTIKWCPAPDCSFAIEVQYKTGDLMVTCKCKHTFCWGCLEKDSHHPIDCDTVLKWIERNKDENESASWLVAYTKQCPKCKRNIEKGPGCMHITCSQPCGHQFCWICLENWIGHKPCNTFSESRAEQTKRKWQARKDTQRYNHYYQRWGENRISWRKAKKTVESLEQEHLKKAETEIPHLIGQLSFIVDAWKQVVRCREVLTWSYVYGYYLDSESAKASFFEYSQGIMEENLDRLHKCAEGALDALDRKLKTAQVINEIINKDSEIRLTNLTMVCASYFDKLVEALEGGLNEVSCREYKGREKATDQDRMTEVFARGGYHAVDVALTVERDREEGRNLQ